MERNKLKIWELALLLALCVTLSAGAWAGSAAGGLSGKLVRLHVVADSDSEQAQETKRLVRDSVLEYLSPLLDGVTDQGRAVDIISNNVDNLRLAAESAAEGESVEVTLCRESFPTRYYDGFALPAGQYTSLRVTLGGGTGRNWWCVVFPTLCSVSSGGDALEAAGLTDGEIALITEGEGYELRFRLLELIGRIAS